MFRDGALLQAARRMEAVVSAARRNPASPVTGEQVDCLAQASSADRNRICLISTPR